MVNSMHVLYANEEGMNDSPPLTIVRSQKRILYIDDDADDRDNFRYVLGKSRTDINLITAVDADDALKKLASQLKPDCIYLDINMPKMNGIELLKILKSNTDFRQIPVIIFSTTVDEKCRKEAMNLGAAAVFLKPSSLQGFLDHVYTSLSTHFPNELPFR